VRGAAKANATVILFFARVYAMRLACSWWNGTRRRIARA
jgi:hypothetical protein